MAFSTKILQINGNFRNILFIFVLILPACAGSSRTMLYQADAMGKVGQKSFDRLVWENNMGPDDKILNTPFFTGDFSSYHLIQIKDRETAHRHDYHDVVVFFQSGDGIMNLGKGSFRVKGNSIVLIPHGTVHKFINLGPAPAAAIEVYSPPYDGKDTIEVDVENKQGAGK